MRVATISVDGIAQAAKKGLFDWISQEQPDVVCIQDLRAHAIDLEKPAFQPEGYEVYLLDAEDPADGGVAIYSREIPKAIIYGFSHPAADQAGRFLQADFNHVSLVSLLAPPVTKDAEKQQQRQEFQAALMEHFHKTRRKRRQFIFCGGFQSPPFEEDMGNALFKHEERWRAREDQAWFSELFDSLDYIDAYREVHLSTDGFTWWPGGWRRASGKNGLRTDLQITTPGLLATIVNAEVAENCRFSSHLPVIVDYAI